MCIVFMGTPSYAAVILESLLKNYTICALVCQEDKKAGRNLKLKIPATKELVQNLGQSIPILQPQILDNDFAESLKEFKPDFIIVAAYGKILPKAVLDIAPCVNLHASILPRFRGASPIQQSILENEKYFGVTLMQMAEGLDCGDILGFRVCKNTKQNAQELFAQISKMAAQLTLEYLENYKKIIPLPQIEADSTLCRKIKKEFGVVEFDNATKLESKFLAYVGWPEIMLKSGLKLKSVRVAEAVNNYKAGEILEITQEQVRIGCKKGSVWIGNVQAPSKKEIPAFAYLQGRRLKIGDILE
ncbi:MAG: methionyl-tRNA formyltransferase [Helicobacter sp.]|nr:methionyl-tRNA formyltransferase [Helicobacteraceae bacterium]MDY3112731.1 methionyl-tRNA formyltransferase [Helicobacter sp.]